MFKHSQYLFKTHRLKRIFLVWKGKEDCFSSFFFPQRVFDMKSRSKTPDFEFFLKGKKKTHTHTHTHTHSRINNHNWYPSPTNAPPRHPIPLRRSLFFWASLLIRNPYQPCFRSISFRQSSLIEISYSKWCQKTSEHLRGTCLDHWSWQWWMTDLTSPWPTSSSWR